FGPALYLNINKPWEKLEEITSNVFRRTGYLDIFRRPILNNQLAARSEQTVGLGKAAIEVLKVMNQRTLEHDIETIRREAGTICHSLLKRHVAALPRIFSGSNDHLL